MKERYYCVKASKGQNDDISFWKNTDEMVCVHMGYSEVDFTVKECKEIIEKLKQCIKD